MEPWQLAEGGLVVVHLERPAAVLSQRLGLMRQEVGDIILLHTVGDSVVDLASPFYFPSLGLGEDLAGCLQF
jgi:hypothetical protein